MINFKIDYPLLFLPKAFAYVYFLPLSFHLCIKIHLKGYHVILRLLILKHYIQCI